MNRGVFIDIIYWKVGSLERCKWAGRAGVEDGRGWGFLNVCLGDDVYMVFIC